MREYRRRDFKWDGFTLRLQTGRGIVTVVEDTNWPGMYRVLQRSGKCSDMVNLTRAKDAAELIAIQELNLHGAAA